MMRFHLLLAAFLFMAFPALAQNTATVVADCGTPFRTYAAGSIQPLLQDTTGRACATGTGTTTTTPGAVTPILPTGTLTLTTGGTAQAFAAVSVTARSCVLNNPSTAAGQNIAAAESVWVSPVTTAVAASAASSIEILPGGTLITPPSTLAISWIAATTAHRVGGYCY